MTPESAPAPVDRRAYRLTSIDFLRGLVIVIMAIDHARDYFLVGGGQDPMAMADPGVPLYATRWITHLCAPTFVFLAGTSAGLMAARKSSVELGRFLLTRGLWLIVVEIVLISTATTMSPISGVSQMGGALVFIMQVIWAIGAAMVALAGLQFLGPRACLALGAAIVLGHNALDSVWPSPALFQPTSDVWVFLLRQGTLELGSSKFIMLYPLLPWIGVMLLGFGTASVFRREPAERDTIVRRVGLACVAAFIALRAVDVYGDPNPWQAQAGVTATVLDFLNVTKYPPSVLFLLATLGPMAILCSYADRLKGRLKDTLVMFGRVPFAFYVAHLFLLHAMCIAFGAVTGFSPGQLMTIFPFFPRDYGTSLVGVYVAWFSAVVLLYPLCAWVARVKARSRSWWLSYV